MGKEIPVSVLNSGHSMPVIGLGTATMPLPSPDQLISAFMDAIEVGYRHFDTASVYITEAPLGQAIAQALHQGLIKNRDEVFVTSKLWCSDAHYDLVLPALKETLKKLGLDYVDLYLIHWPVRMKPGTSISFTKEDLLPFDIRETWEAMEECSRLGLAKSIGVSNFSSKKLSQLLAHATIPPAVNQVELNAAWRQRKLRDFCNKNGIKVAACSPLGANGAFWGSFAVMKSPILKDIAMAKGKSIAQIALRWIYQVGGIPIVKSFNKERMKENLEIFDWKLSNEELDQINQIPECKGELGEAFVTPEGSSYKSIEQLWDGEISKIKLPPVWNSLE